MRSIMDSKGMRRLKREVKVHQLLSKGYVALISLCFFLLNLALYTCLVWAAWLVVVVNHFDGNPLTTPESIILGFVVIFITRRYYLTDQKMLGLFLRWQLHTLRKIVRSHAKFVLPDNDAILRMLRNLDLD